MQEKFFRNIKNDLSAERLNAYGKQDNPDQRTLLARYFWNMAVSESLYSPLQILEIALRNKVHEQLCQKYGPEWYEDAPLSQLQSEDIGRAKESLRKERKIVHVDAIVAELNFGFWTSFFNRENERNGLSFVAAKAFKKAPKSLKVINKLSQRLNKIRKLRNRIFHHERIIHWRDLPQQHQEILETIHWLSQDLHEVARVFDRLVEVHERGLDPWINKIEKHWSKGVSDDK